MTIVYAILQNYVADFACSCGYFAVFIYVEFIVCCVEIAGAVYKERHDSVFSHSTYGQVVFGVQSVGLEGVYTGNVAVLINGYLIVNLNIAAIQNDGGSAVGNLVTGYVNICQLAALISVYTIFGCNSAGSFDSTIGTADAYILTGNITHHDIIVQVNFINLLAINSSFFNISVVAIYNLAVLACFSSYFLQLLFGCSLTGSCKAIISSSCIAKSAYSCSSAIHNNIACCYTAACPNRALAAADVYISVVIISCKFNIVFQSHIILHTAVFCLFRGYSNISALGNNTVFACFGCYFLQLLFGCSLTFAVSKAIISSSCIAKPAYSCSSTIHDNTAIYSAAYCHTAVCPDSAFAAADAYKIVSISFKSNIVIQSNFVFLATVFIGVFGYSNISTIGNSTVFECFCWRISSHRRSHACTGHNTCCNQHCQQFFSGAAFAAMIFRNFRNNNVCVACFTPDNLKYLVHKTLLLNIFKNEPLY